MKADVSRSSSGSRVSKESRPFIGTGGIAVVMACSLSPGACDIYTPGLLMTSAGGVFASSSGASAANVGGGASSSAGGTSDRTGSSVAPQAGSGGTTRATTDTGAGGAGGATSETRTSAEGGTEQDSGSSDSGGATSAAAGNANGGAAGATTAEAGGNSAQKCWLDDMRGSSATAPLEGCDSSRTSNWATFLPPSGSILVKPPTIVPDPGVIFERKSATSADMQALGDVQFVATVSGKVVVSDPKKYSGLRFPLYVGAPYAIRGAVLHFYYRTNYAAPASSLRVNIPTTATTDRQKPGGTCPQNCDDHFGYYLPNSQGNWSRWSLRLETTANQGDLTRDWPQSDGVTFDVTQVLAVEFGLSDSQPFEFSIGPIWLEWPSA